MNDNMIKVCILIFFLVSLKYLYFLMRIFLGKSKDIIAYAYAYFADYFRNDLI